MQKHKNETVQKLKTESDLLHETLQQLEKLKDLETTLMNLASDVQAIRETATIAIAKLQAKIEK
jgi:hypothetical protein